MVSREDTKALKGVGERKSGESRFPGKQSFAAFVKGELVRAPAGKNCCMLSEISALTQTSGHLAFRGGGRISVSYRTDRIPVARRLFQLLKKRLDISPTLHFLQSPQLGGRKVCVLSLTEKDTGVLLNALHMLETDEEGMTRLRYTVPRHPMTRKCCRRAFLRGAFLGTGTMTDPEKGYHLEWTAEDEHLPETLGKLLEKCEMPFHTYERRGKRVVYLKSAEDVSVMLAMMGANRGVLEMENTRIKRMSRGRANRAANCDEHNSERMLDAGHRQAERLAKLRDIDMLPEALRETARLRIANPDVSLQELGDMMDPRVGKSAVNARMRRLMKICEQTEEAK